MEITNKDRFDFYIKIKNHIKQFKGSKIQDIGILFKEKKVTNTDLISQVVLIATANDIETFDQLIIFFEKKIMKVQKEIANGNP